MEFRKSKGESEAEGVFITFILAVIIVFAMAGTKLGYEKICNIADLAPYENQISNK